MSSQIIDPWDGIFCCFGCLTLSGFRNEVTRRLVYFPPKPPLYIINNDRADHSNGVELQNMEMGNDGRVMSIVDECGDIIDPLANSPNFKFEFVKTRRGSTIATFFIKCSTAASDITVVFSHANAADIGCLRDYLREFARDLQVNVFAYDYSGYGHSSGLPCPANTYADVEAAYEHIKTQYPVEARRVLMYGQSLGSGPSLYLAARKPVIGVVIHSGIISCLKVLNPEWINQDIWFDVYDNGEMVKLVDAPVMVIHGDADEDIPLIHGKTISENAPNSYKPWYVPDGGHNDIEARFRDILFEKLSDFFQYLNQDAIRA